MALQPLHNCYLQEGLSTKPSQIYSEEDPETAQAPLQAARLEQRIRPWP